MKSITNQSPPGLPGIEPFDGPDVLQVFVISPHQERVLAPSRQWLHTSRATLMANNSLIPHIIIYLSGREFPGEEGAGMEFVVLFGPLGEDCPDSYI